jgi:hypothetical protein
MTRAYIRLDPAFDERKYDYTDGAYSALVATLCLAEHQPDRGRFRSLAYLSRLLGKRGRHVGFLVEQGDVTELPDGRAYVAGWDEWQEGDWKVGERVARIRDRRRRNGDGNGGGNASGNGQDNGPPSEVSAGGGVPSAGGGSKVSKDSNPLADGRLSVVPVNPERETA